MLKLKPYQQQKGFCGPTSLKMVMDYYGIFVSEDEIAKIADSHKRWGTSTEGMVKAARHFGFKVYHKEDATIKDIKHFVLKKNMPVIVRWFFEDEGHYSVIVDVDKNNIVMMDPALNKILIYVRRRKMPVKKFQKIWFDLAESEKRVALPREIIRRFIMVLIPKK